MDAWLASTIPALMERMGYWGIALLMFLENLFPPIPSELIMPLAGFAVARGQLNLGLAIGAGVLGTLLGALPWYYLGASVGEARLRRWIHRYGRWLTLSEAEMTRANRWFRRHGGKTVLLCRLVPGVRTLISLPAGINRMAIAQFLTYSAVGTTLWVGLLTYLGYALGERYDQVNRYLGPAAQSVLFSLLLGFGGFVLVRKQHRRASRVRNRS